MSKPPKGSVALARDIRYSLACHAVVGARTFGASQTALPGKGGSHAPLQPCAAGTLGGLVLLLASERMEEGVPGVLHEMEGVN
jgi:hypothetical protein